jgi:hypothetical protein
MQCGADTLTLSDEKIMSKQLKSDKKMSEHSIVIIYLIHRGDV